MDSESYAEQDSDFSSEEVGHRAIAKQALFFYRPNWLNFGSNFDLPKFLIEVSEVEIAAKEFNTDGRSFNLILSSESLQDKFPEQKRPQRAKKVNYCEKMMQEQRGEEDQLGNGDEAGQSKRQEIASDQDSVFSTAIDLVLWMKNNLRGEPEYLVKYKNRSYLHTEWLSEESLISTSKSAKSKLNQFLKFFDPLVMRADLGLDAENQQFFDSSYLEVDRILSAASMFAVVHQKKANEIRGKWSQSLCLVCEKLLNFSKQQIHYGIYFSEPITEEECPDYKKVISSPIDLGTIINRVYLDYYKVAIEFWKDLGMVWKNCRKYTKDRHSDMSLLGETLRQASLILYKQWHQLSIERYDAIKKEFHGRNAAGGKASAQKIKQNVDQDEMEQNCKNIFLEKRKCNPPSNIMELEKFNPGLLTYFWIAEENESDEKFKEFEPLILQPEDVKVLSLNHEIDHLYLIKWKNLSHTDSTWELESSIGNGHPKILEFRTFNRALDKESRLQMTNQNERHKALIRNQSTRQLSFQTLTDIRNKLYFYDVLSRKKTIPQYTQSAPPIFKDYKLLRDYQLESLNWLIVSWYQSRNVILADEMGLGKTIQTIAFLNHLYQIEACRGPFLVVAPLSTLQHWKRTVQDWTNLNGILYYDNRHAAGREFIRNYEWHYTDITTKGTVIEAKDLHKFHIIITSSEVFRSDFQDIFLKIPFQFIVIDQAHRLKNQKSTLLRDLKLLPCKRTLLLTGTPIQNNIKQLFCLLNFIEPKKFHNQQDFLRQFGNLATSEQIQHLNSIIKPYILRRMKEDVERSIPPLKETIIDVQMTTLQKTIYRALYERNKGVLVQKGLSSKQIAVNNLEMQLRKCCNHPFLIQQIEEQLMNKCTHQDERVKRLLEASGKMTFVNMLLDKYKTQGKKVLIFSQFKHTLSLLEELLNSKGFRYERLDGQVKASDRQNAIDRYNNPEKKRDVFLLSTRAGGMGINLTSANVVIIFDSDWNPQNDVQAIARAHRIGQSQEVQVFRLVTIKTYESEMFERAAQKLGLDQAIFLNGEFKTTKDDGKSQQKNDKISKKELEIILRKGMLGLYEQKLNDQQVEGDEFYEANIDDIIAKNSRQAEYSVVKGAYSLNKSKFVSEQCDNQINIHDPNFWEIVLKTTDSKSHKLLKKLNSNPSSFRSPTAQKEFMRETSELVNYLIQSKISLSGYNADDEKNIISALSTISTSKVFMQRYRDLAGNWLDQVNRPSRRFKKINFEELDGDEQANPQSIATRRRSKEEREEEVYIEEQQEQEAELQEQKPKKKRSNRLKRQDQSETEKKRSEEKQSKRSSKQPNDEFLNRQVNQPCCICLKPKCSVFCSGLCKRSFHKHCKKVHEKGHKSNSTQQQQNGPNELQIQCEAMLWESPIRQLCKDCAQGQAECFICKRKLKYSDKQKTNQVVKCSYMSCGKFYHQDCIKSRQSSSKFIFDEGRATFRCPLHFCSKCNQNDDRKEIIQCVRCPNACHKRCKDSDKIKMIGKTFMICDKHDDALDDVPQKKKKLKRLSRKRLMSQSEDERKDGNEIAPKKMKKITDTILATKQQKRPINYESLSLQSPSKFDYAVYPGKWCRYCGTRFASLYDEGPWGNNTLCATHHIEWKKKLILQGNYPKTVTKPIEPSKQQLQTIIHLLNKSPNRNVKQLLEERNSVKH